MQPAWAGLANTYYWIDPSRRVARSHGAIVDDRQVAAVVLCRRTKGTHRTHADTAIAGLGLR